MIIKLCRDENAEKWQQCMQPYDLGNSTFCSENFTVTRRIHQSVLAIAVYARHDISNNQHLDRLVNSILRQSTKKASKLNITGPFEEILRSSWLNRVLAPAMYTHERQELSQHHIYWAPFHRTFQQIRPSRDSLTLIMGIPIQVIHWDNPQEAHLWQQSETWIFNDSLDINDSE